MSVCSPNYEANGNFPYRCIVPECESSSVKTPEKLWIEAPTDLDSRTIWLNLALWDPEKWPIPKSQMYFCEDHFDLENDMENYEQFKTMGSVERVRMKPDCVPSRFDCQKNRIQITTSHQQPQFLVYSPNDQPVSSQTQMPIFLTLLTEDNCNSYLPQDVAKTALLVTLFCVCCLARDVPFVRLVTCCHAEFLNSMMRPEMKRNYQVICYQCHNMLKKIKQFKLQVEESFKLLSDSSENIPKKSNQRLNYRRQNFSMVIPDANRKKKPTTIRIKPNIRIDHIINEEKIEAKDKTKKSPTPKSSEKKDKQTKNIKEAFKIINNNQNSEAINLLANSLQNLSSTLLSDMIYPSFDLGNPFDTTLAAEMNISGNKALTSNITTSSTENINYVIEENVFIADSTNVAVTPAISTENITDVIEENVFQADSINVATKDISTENFTNIFEDISFDAESSNIGTNLAISTENLTNILGENVFETISTIINSCSPTENLSSKVTEAFTNADIPTEWKNMADSTDLATNPAMSTENLTKKKTEEKSLGSYSINDYINFSNSTMSIEELININKEDGSILDGEIDERIICDTYVLDDNVACEELIQLVTEEEASIGEKQKSVGGGESTQVTSIELININKEDGSILNDEIDERIICDTYGLGDNVAGEKLIQPVTEEEASIGEEQESVGGGESNVQEDSIGVDPPEKQESVGSGESNVQPVGTEIGLEKGPILGSNIKQLTLTREQLMEERAKTAASQAYLRAPHKCETCIIGFQFAENLEDHFKRKHTSGTRLEIQCDVCQQFVEYGASYDLHTFWHHTRYQCVFCDQMFASYDKAALHYRKQHSKIPYRYRYRPNQVVTFRCPRCSFKTGRKRLLTIHMKECNTCKQCGVTIGTTTDVTLETHLKNCTGAPSEPKRAKRTPKSTATETLEN